MAIPEFFEFAMTALFQCHVDYLAIGGFNMVDYQMMLIAQYAPGISVKRLLCSHLGAMLHRPADPLELDHALLYATFEKFASIQSIACSSCAIGIENELRNLCAAKQITFVTL